MPAALLQSGALLSGTLLSLLTPRSPPDSLSV